MYTSSFNGAEIDHLLGLAAIGEYKQLTDVNTFEVGNYYVESGSAMNALPNKTRLPKVLQDNPAGFNLYIRRISNAPNAGKRVIGLLTVNNEGMFIIMKSNSGATAWETYHELLSYKSSSLATYNDATRHYGTTAQRPSDGTITRGDSNKGFFYFDTTLGKPIFYVGNAVDDQNNAISSTGWVDATGAGV